MNAPSPQHPHDDHAMHHAAQLHPSLIVRVILWTVGTVALLLGIAGIFLPVLPSTPFVLVAATCYARASGRFYLWLVHNPTFGPLIREWRLHHSIPWRIKLVAIGMMSLTISFSIWTLEGHVWLRVMLAIIGITTGVWLWRVPSRDRPKKSPE